MSKSFKIRIFQPVVQEYRVALYKGLAERYGDRIEVWASSRRGGEISVPLEKMRYDYNHPMTSVGPFVWQKGFNLGGLGKGDVIVIGGDIHYLSSLWLALKAKWRGIRVVWWGHHKSALAKERNVRIRLWFARRLADVMLCYTDVGIRYLLDRGFENGKVFATGNTLDLASVERATAGWDGVRKFGDKKTLLFCGVLRDKVRVDVLLKALKVLSSARNDLHCVIIGGGDMEVEWKALSKELGTDSLVTWVGELRGQNNLAPWFLSSDLFVYPGSIGLSLIHAFAFGLPVVLNDNKDNHGPEYDVFRPGINGWQFKENDEKDLAKQIETALGGKDMRSKGLAGKDYVFRNYSMQRMIERTAEAIEAASIS